MKKPDWDVAEQKLLKEALGALKDMRAHHADQLFSYFAFDANAPYGHVLVSLDTLDNSIQVSQNEYKQFAKNWHKRLNREWSSVDTNSLGVSRPLPFSDWFGDFSYAGYRELQFPAWRKYLDQAFAAEESGKLVRSERGDSAEQYVEAQAARIMFRTLNTLVKMKAFAGLQLAERFGVGFTNHEGPPVTCHVLNWPRV
jgi:hypothetical protein